MKKLFIFAILLIPFTSCITEPPAFILIPPSEETPALTPFVITDHKNNHLNLGIPEWVNRFFESGTFGLQAIEAAQGSYLFIARSEGNNFNALQLWNDGFNAELAFPRLAAARVETRFSAGVHFPDLEYGPLYETLIRAVSDNRWTGMARVDDFWVRRAFYATDNEAEREDWEFLVLVTIEKSYFAYQLNSIFETLAPRQPPSEIQRQRFDQVAERFFQGF